MNPIAAAYVSNVARSTARDLDHMERALAHVSDDEVWHRPNTVTNSIGNLLLHLSGSHRFWIVSVAGQQPSARQRQAEFDARDGATKAELLAVLRQTVADATGVLRALNGDDLLETREAFGREWTVLDAIQHSVVHFSLHTGQVLQLVKMQKGIDLALPQ